MALVRLRPRARRRTRADGLGGPFGRELGGSGVRLGGTCSAAARRSARRGLGLFPPCRRRNPQSGHRTGGVGCMKRVFACVVVLGGSGIAAPALADEDCASAKGDIVIAARTPQVDLYDAAMGKRVMTLDQDKFPACAPIVARASNMMLEVEVNGGRYWV